MGSGSDARAVAFVEITTPARATLFGVGMHENIVTASLLAVLSAVNRALQRGLLDDSMPAAQPDARGLSSTERLAVPCSRRLLAGSGLTLGSVAPISSSAAAQPAM